MQRWHVTCGSGAGFSPVLLIWDFCSRVSPWLLLEMSPIFKGWPLSRVERPSRMLQQAKAIRVSLVLPTAATGQRALPPCREDRVPLCSARLGRSPLSLFMNKVRFLREIQVFPRADISRVRTCRFTSVACAWLWLPGPGLPASAAPTRPGTVLPILRSFLAPWWMNARAAAMGMVPWKLGVRLYGLACL